MNDAAEQLPDDLASALALLAQERARRIKAEAEAASAKALVSHSEALIARLKLEIEKVRRELYGSRSERKARLLEQMELHLSSDPPLSQQELFRMLTLKSYSDGGSGTGGNGLETQDLQALLDVGIEMTFLRDVETLFKEDREEDLIWCMKTI